MNAEQRQSVIDNINSLMQYRYANQTTLADTYAYIALYYNCFGHMPAVKETGYHFGVTEKTASRRLARLRLLGYLRMPTGADRGSIILALQEAA